MLPGVFIFILFSLFHMVFCDVTMLNESPYRQPPLMAYSITLNFYSKLQKWESKLKFFGDVARLIFLNSSKKAKKLFFFTFFSRILFMGTFTVLLCIYTQNLHAKFFKKWKYN